MNPELRRYFDEQLEMVVAELPTQVHKLLDEVPLFVEDFPSRDVLRRTGIRDRARLCGLYTGVPLIDRSVDHWGVPSDVIHLYREGILGLAITPGGSVDEAELREQIRKTILHELGHHHGLTEDELGELGYG